MAARKTKNLKRLISKIETLLGKRMRGFHSELVQTYTGERIVGYVVSSEFRPGLDHAPRQRKLRQILESALDPAELEHVGPIVTMTPSEAGIKRRAA